MLQHRKVDCLKLKGKKESKSEVNVTQATKDGSDSDSSVVSLIITTRIICYSDVSEWILDMGATYHVTFKREWFTSFEKLDSSMVQMDDNSTCSMDGVGTIFIKMF